MDIRNLILTTEEYKQVKFQTPYIIRVEKKGQEMIYIGASHKTDPLDNEFTIIENEWNVFCSKHSANSITAVIESGLRETEYDRDKSIEHYSESGLLVYLAQVSGVRIACFEPSRGEMMNACLDKYSKEEIFYQYMAQIVVQWNRHANVPPLQEYVQPHMQRARRETGWNDFDFSMENIKKIHADLFGSDFDKTHKDFFRKIVSPHETDTVINLITKAHSNIREVRIVEGIYNEWKNGKNIFVVYGSGHAIVQERALRTLLNS